MRIEPVADRDNPGKWAIRWPRPGRQRNGRQNAGYKGGFKTPAAARKYAAAQVVAESAAAPIHRPTGITRLADVAPLWLATLDLGAFNTWRLAEWAWRVHISAIFGTWPLDTLDGYAIERWLRTIELAPNTVANIRTEFSALLSYAVRQKYLATNPLVDVPAEHRIQPATVEPVMALSLPEAELYRSLLPRHLAIIAIIATWCGLRSGEVRALRLRDIDFAAGVIHVRRQVIIAKSGPRFTLPKHRRTRTVPMDAEVAEAITLHLWEYRDGATDPDDLLVLNARGGVATPDSLPRPEAVRATALPRRTSFHSLRHFYASQQLAHGTPLSILSIYMGHGDSRVTERLYKHLVPGHDDQARSVQARARAANARTMRGTADIEAPDQG